MNPSTSFLDKRVEPLYNQASTSSGLMTWYFCHGFRNPNDDAKFITKSYLFKKIIPMFFPKNSDVQLQSKILWKFIWAVLHKIILYKYKICKWFPRNLKFLYFKFVHALLNLYASVSKDEVPIQTSCKVK